MGRNQLRRPCDRIEGAVVLLLLAAFLAAIAGTVFLGRHIYESQRAAAARVHPGVAVLTKNGPYNAGLNWAGQTTARWRTSDGRLHSGVLTTQTTPAIWNAPAGDRIPVWLTASGQPVAAPPDAAEVIFTSVVIGVAAAGGAGTVLIGCYGLARLLLDWRRLAAWESAWDLTGPLWTPRR